MFKPSSSNDPPFTSCLFFNLELYRQSLSQRAIADKIGRSKTVIANFLKDPETYWTA